MRKVLFMVLACMTVMHSTYGQDLHWTPVEVGDFNMTCTGVVTIDGEEQKNANLEIGVFCGDQCRGAKKPIYVSSIDRYLYIITMFGEAGDVFTFKLFDHSLQQELELNSPEAVNYEPNGRLGTAANPYILNFTSPTSTYNLPINAWTENGGYYLIAPPFDDINPAEIEGMVTGTGEYDLYYFDQAQELEWRNYKDGAFNLQSGKGYLYAHSTNVTLTFTGTPYNGDGKVTLRKTGGLDFEGWNLVGNPFATAAALDRPFYVMNPAGTEIITATGTGVAAMQGIFVIAATDNEQIQFTQSGSGSKEQIVLNVLQDRGNTIDRAIVRFNESSTLPKFMLNDSNTKLYIPQEDDDYAVVNSNGANSMPVNFKAMANGTYTLSVDINLDMEYLHLIDNKTGADIDLLVQPDYQFAADKNDNEARFMLVFRSTTGVEENGQQNFCFVKGSNLYFNEDVQNAELSLVDITGRLVRQMTLKGNSCDLSGISEGLYIVRLAKDNEVKVQKVVIR